MAISTNYHNGTPCYVISGVTSYELPKCESSEPRYIRSIGPDILVVSAKAGQTINGSASVSLSPNDCMLINPIGTDWVLIMQILYPSIRLDSRVEQEVLLRKQLA
jgi:hypothetical protein